MCTLVPQTPFATHDPSRRPTVNHKRQRNAMTTTVLATVLAVPPPSVPRDGVHRSEVGVCGVLQWGAPRDCPF